MTAAAMADLLLALRAAQSRSSELRQEAASLKEALDAAEARADAAEL